MRKIKLQMQVSLDGFVSGPHGEIGWMSRDWDDEIKSYVTGLTDSADTLLMGRGLYQGMSAHWPAVAANPESRKTELEFAEKMNNLSKIVFSKSLEQASWSNTILLRGELEDEVARLKQMPGKDLLLYGGAGLASSFVEAGLIDEYHLFINPAAIGNGKSIFQKRKDNLNFNLIWAKPFSCGIVAFCFEETGKK